MSLQRLEFSLLLGPRKTMGTLYSKLQRVDTWTPVLEYNTRPCLLTSLFLLYSPIMITSQDETWGGRGVEGTRKSGQKGKSKKKKKPPFWWQFNPRLISLSLSLSFSLFLPASTHQGVCPLSWFQLYSDKSASLWRAQRIKWHHLPIALGIRVWGWRVGIVSSIYGWDSKGTGLFCGWWQVPGSGWGRQGWAEARFLLWIWVWKQDASLSVPIPWVLSQKSDQNQETWPFSDLPNT